MKILPNIKFHNIKMKCEATGDAVFKIKWSQKGYIWAIINYDGEGEYTLMNQTHSEIQNEFNSGHWFKIC